jgi:hypothetical protein
MTQHQRKQVEVIDRLEKQINSNVVSFSTVSPVQNYETDPRITLTSVHFPHQDLIMQIQSSLIGPLHEISPDNYYYQSDSLHMTIKNIRVISDPPDFIPEDIVKAQEVFDSVIPRYKKFKVYFYRLLLFANNLALIGTTDEELDKIVLDLDRELKEAGVADNKRYINLKHFFSNMTLMRFNYPLTDQFKQKIQELSNSVTFNPYIVDSISLITANAAMKNKNIIQTWELL